MLIFGMCLFMGKCSISETFHSVSISQWNSFNGDYLYTHIFFPECEKCPESLGSVLGQFLIEPICRFTYNDYVCALDRNEDPSSEV